MRVRARDLELEGPPPKRAISPLVPKSSTPAVNSSASTVPMPDSRIPNVMRHRTEREPGDTVFTESDSSFNTQHEWLRHKKLPVSSVGTKKAWVSSLEVVSVLSLGATYTLLLVRHKRNSHLYSVRVLPSDAYLPVKNNSASSQNRAILRRMAVEGTNPFVIRLWRGFHDVDNLFWCVSLKSTSSRASILTCPFPGLPSWWRPCDTASALG